MKRLRAGAPAAAPLIVLLAIYILVRSAHFDYVPLWDGRFTHSEMQAVLARQGLNPFAYALFNHSSILLLWLFACIERFFAGDVLAFNLAILCLGLACVLGFHALLRATTPLNDVERALATALLAFHPTILSTLVQFSTDLGVLALLPLYVWSVLTRRYRVSAALGLAMVFCKESAVILLPAAWLLRARPDWKWVRDTALGLALPLAGFFLYYLLKSRLPGPEGAGQAGLWSGLTLTGLITTFLNPLSGGKVALAYWAEMFALSFSWALGLGILFACRRKRFIPAFLSLLYLAYALTRFQTFTNLRYVSYAAVFLVLVYAMGVARMASARARLAALAVPLVLLATSCWHSWDPVSRAIFGTFEFGTHRMFRMTSVTGECCGLYGRDQLIYNLQFLALQDVQNEAYELIRPTAQTIILTSAQANFSARMHLLAGPLDRRSFHRSLGGPNSFTPAYTLARELRMRQAAHRPLPPEVYYLQFPLFDDHEEIAATRSLYQQVQSRKVSSHGYEIRLYRFSVPRAD
ncbi:MAG: hypothetical protein QM718_06925 [Steroidobacteraceae bacterium]